jgi:hypothetical protein
MADETTEPQGSADDETAATPADVAAGPDASAKGEHKHGFKHELRDVAAKAVGYTVEVASILGQQGGPAVEAERDVAEANTEDFIDRIDGDG